VVAAAASKKYNITLLPGDGIGPEIMKVAREVLDEVGRSLRTSTRQTLHLLHPPPRGSD